MSTARSKLAAILVLFFVGLFAGRVADLLHAVSGTVERGTRLTGQLDRTVATIRQLDTGALEAQIAELRLKLTNGTATPAQVESLKALVARLRASTGPPGTPGPAGPVGPPGTSAGAPSTTTNTTAPGGTTTSSRPATTTTTRPAPTTTTRCLVGLGRIAKVGC